MKFDAQQLITDPRAKILNTPCRPVSGDDWDAMPALHKKMLEIMKKENGLGLTANQIGVPLAVIVRWDGDILINPKIVSLLGKVYNASESCLSVPNRFFFVPRRERVVIKYQTPNRTWKEEIEAGLDAQVIQHEMDHINGLVIENYASVEVKIGGPHNKL